MPYLTCKFERRHKGMGSGKRGWVAQLEAAISGEHPLAVAVNLSCRRGVVA